MIYLAPISNPVRGAIGHVSHRVEEIFKMTTSMFAPNIDTTVAFDGDRHQYNSTVLLAELLKDLPAGDAKVLGIVDVDLYIPVLTFVFGEAQLGGNVGIVSSYRLQNSIYGLPDDHDLFLDRLVKEVVHELGHMFRLLHCHDYECVMKSSASVEEVDLKRSSFCEVCLAKLEAQGA